MKDVPITIIHDLHGAVIRNRYPARRCEISRNRLFALQFDDGGERV